ncbi:MAG TPA: glucosamine-6-phosphate deaminase [Candidatus Pullichristensenella avicola]|nr:glucosamine-6-phosphate deaminase [Candidatus Pullichristensenella avicola]
MQVHIYETPELAAKAAAALIAAAILDKPNMVLGLPTGSSPVNTYKELARMNREGVVDFSRVITYNLDEYVGLEGTHEQSYRYFMNANLFDHVNIDKANTHVPCGVGDDPEKNARDYEAAIEKAGGIDLQFMGIGRNGHIGFNEPADAFPDATSIIDLTESTIEANKRFFASRDEVPRRAISMGVGTIMRARRTLLIATGADKAEAVRGMLQGPVTPRLPASALRFHQDCVIVLDKAAASLL